MYAEVCKPVTRQVCEKVHYTEQCRRGAKEEGRDVNERKCETVEKEECQNVPKTDCKEHTERQCHSFPRQECKVNQSL